MSSYQHITEWPLPKGAILKCEKGHITTPTCTSPHRCKECGSMDVLWRDKRKPWKRVIKLKIPTKGWDGGNYRSFRSGFHL